MNKVTSFMRKKLGRAGLILKKNSPDILIAVGAIGTVASVVLACKATLKVDEIKKERDKQIEEIKKCREELPEKYSEKDVKSDTLKVDIHTGIKYARLYAPSGIVLATSLGLIFKSHGILKSRNAALSAAYFAIDSAFKQYRKRVVEKYGDDVDKYLRYGFQEGEPELEKDKIKEEGPKPLKEYSGYAKFFDESSRQWQKSAEYNYMFLRSAQAHFNDILQDRGHIFLNEVYDYLDIPRTNYGQIVGWLKDGDGDGFVDIGLNNIDNEMGRAFVNGYERSILLDFNVDGPIMDKI